MQVENVRPEDYAEMLDVWENSVRATHDFITDDDIAFFKPMIIEQAFPAVTLRCVKNEGGLIVGFVGVHDSKIEMLFILNEARGQGVGKVLLQYALEQLGATEVDVNEQNPKAVGFYQHMGFKIIERSPLDSMGKSSVFKLLRRWIPAYAGTTSFALTYITEQHYPLWRHFGRKW